MGQSRLLAKATEDQKRFSKEANDLKEEETNLTKELQDLRAQTLDLREEMGKRDAAAKKKQASLEEQLSMREAENDRLAKDHDEVLQLCSSLEIEKKRLQMRVDHADVLVNSLNTELEVEAAKSKRVKGELEGELNNLKEAYSRLQSHATMRRRGRASLDLGGDFDSSASEGEFQGGN